MSFHIFSADRRTKRHLLWLDWLREAASIRERFLALGEDDDPFSYNEAASVSVLCSAAFMAGGLGLAETVSTKLDQSDRRRTYSGRDDLCICLDDEWWFFEAKQTFRPIASVLTSQFDAAMSCARQITSVERERAAGLLISYTGDGYITQGRGPNYTQNVRDFVSSEPGIKLAVGFGGDTVAECRLFLMFSDPVPLRQTR